MTLPDPWDYEPNLRLTAETAKCKHPVAALVKQGTPGSALLL